MKKISIIGSNGYIARNFIYYLKKNENVEIFEYDIQDNKKNNKFYKQIDLMDVKTLDAINTNVDFIYVFAGLTGVKESFSNYDDFIDINIKGLISILNKVVNDENPARIMYPSTRLIYKGKKNYSLKETDDLECNSLYAVTKLACENILEVYHKIYGINYTIFRICIPYGDLTAGNTSYGTIGMFQTSLKKYNNITLYGSGNLKRSFIHIEDLCRALVFLENNTKTINQTFNIGGPDQISLLDLARLLTRKRGGTIKNIPFPELDNKIETGDTIFDDSKLLKLGFDFKKTIDTVTEENP